MATTRQHCLARFYMSGILSPDSVTMRSQIVIQTLRPGFNLFIIQKIKKQKCELKNVNYSIICSEVENKAGQVL